jgi:hypothetical protein
MMGLPNWSARERVARFKEYVEVVDRLLSNEVVSYKGRFYEVEGAVMSPRPVQKPRPPITIAALQPVMLALAARYADTWNSLSFARDFQAQLDETRDRVRIVAEACRATGRDPATLRRSYLMFDAGARAGGGLINYYASEEAFADMVQAVVALGMSEIGVYYPTREEQRPVFERIARDVIPVLKAQHTRAPGPCTRADAGPDDRSRGAATASYLDPRTAPVLPSGPSTLAGRTTRGPWPNSRSLTYGPRHEDTRSVESVGGRSPGPARFGSNVRRAPGQEHPGHPPGHRADGRALV